MPNFVVTNACTASCAYCFASEYRCDPTAARHVTVQDFRAQVAWAQPDTVRLCGGEPTAHPELAALLRVALESPGRRVLLMTNGLWPRAVRDHLRGLPRSESRRLTHLFNVLPPESYTALQRQSLHAALGCIDPRTVTLGVTLHRPPFAYHYLLELAARFGIESLRYSIAAPNLTDAQTWNLDPERDFPELAAVVGRFLVDAHAAGLHVHSDCGYVPPCMFTPAALAELERIGGPKPRCHGPVDIGPDGWAWRCYGLFALVRARIDDYPHAQMLESDFAARVRDLERFRLLDRCTDCSFAASGQCGGGCYAFRLIRALRARGRAADLDIADDAAVQAAVPAIDHERLVFYAHAGYTRWMLREEDTWSSLPLTPGEERVLALCDNQRTVAMIASALGADGTSDGATVTRTMRKLLALDAVTLRRV